MSAVSIRALTRDELAAHIAAFVAIAQDVPGEYWSAEHFLAERPGKWDLSLAAWMNARPIGYAIMSRRTTSTAHLHHFMVSAAYRGQGSGERLMHVALERCVAQGCTAISLKVMPDNRDAIRLYSRHGFVELGDENGYRVMQRALDAGAAARAPTPGPHT